MSLWIWNYTIYDFKLCWWKWQQILITFRKAYRTRWDTFVRSYGSYTRGHITRNAARRHPAGDLDFIRKCKFAGEKENHAAKLLSPNATCSPPACENHRAGFTNARRMEKLRSLFLASAATFQLNYLNAYRYTTQRNHRVF